MIRAILLLAVVLLGGCRTTPPAQVRPVVARFWLEDASGGAVAMQLPVSESVIRVAARPVISEFDIVNVELAEVELGRCLMFQLTPGAARDLFRLSASNQGRRLVLMLNDQPAGARLIEQPIEGGVLYTFVERPDEALTEIVRGLKQTAATVRREAGR